MQSSYNIIKKDYINSGTVYTIKPPLIPVEEVPEAEEAEKPGVSIEDVKAYAEDILNDAKEKSKRIIESANQNADRIRKDAYEIAYKKGYAEGYKKGNEDGVSETDSIRQEARDVLAEAHRLSREYIKNQRGEIISLALHIADKIIGYQADINDSIVAKIVDDAIGAAVVKEQVIIRVNPMDYALVDCRRDDILENAGENIIVNIIRDNSIRRGGCRVETEASSVDATIDAQLEKIREALVG